MKSAEVINQGDSFVTVSKSAESAAEVAPVLARQGVRRVYKGDQNQLWDAVLTNQCLVHAVGGSLPEGLTLFVQDEKMGTPDARLRHYWRQRGQQFVLTEDYYAGRSGAVWEHQDASYGLFYTEPVEPHAFAEAAVNLRRAADLWTKHGAAAMRDTAFLDAMQALGVSLRWHRSDDATRLGPPVGAGVYAEFFDIRPEAGFYYALTKSTGLYGIVPSVNEDVTTSSIPAYHEELIRQARWLLVHVAARGAMRDAGDRRARRAVKERARRLAAWAQQYLGDQPGASIADFQTAIGAFLAKETGPAALDGQAMPPLDRTSRFMALDPEEIYRLEQPERSLYFFLDLALRDPGAFAAAYNEALNRVGFGLQRVKHEPDTGLYRPPFFVEYAPAGEGTPIYRFSLELAGRETMRVTLAHRRIGTIVLESEHPIRSAAQLFRLLCDQLPAGGPIAVVGKAAPFAAELKRWPRTMALPRQGSKYAPMIDHLLAGLKERGLLQDTSGLVLRVGLNGLDALAALGDRPISVPAFLRAALGERTTCRALAERWRGITAAARASLALLHRCQFGQHVHLARVLAHNSQGRDLATAAAADPRLHRFLRAVAGPEPEAWTPWAAIGADVPAAVGATLDALLARRDALLARRRERSGSCPPELEAERQTLDCQLLLLYAAYVRRLCQQADSLPYLNDRPYSLALWLLFGPEIFRAIVEHAAFDFEFMCERVPQTSASECRC
jgi:hypothetical protein